MVRKPRHLIAGERYSCNNFRPYVIAIGQAALAWNDLHQRLALLFERVSGAELYGTGLAIWNAAPSDRAAREMLRATLPGVPNRWLRGFPAAQDDIAWLLTEAEKLEDARNNTVHVPLWMVETNTRGTEILPQFLLGHRRANRLLEKDLLTEFRWCRDTALVLRNYAIALRNALTYREPSELFPWPDRPTLPNRGHKKAPQAERRPVAPKLPVRQRRSSAKRAEARS